MPRRQQPKKPTEPRARHGSGMVRLKGKSWQALWSEGGVRKTKGGFATKDAALTHIETATKAARDAQTLADYGLTPVKPKDPTEPKTFKELLPDFIEYRRGLKHRSVRDDASRWNQHLSVLDDRLPSAVTVADVEALAVRIAGTPKASPKKGKKGPAPHVAGSTVRLVLNLLSAFYKWAGKTQGVTGNPARAALSDAAVKKLIAHRKPDPAKTPFIEDRAKVAALFQKLQGIQPVVAIHYALDAMAGLRPGEATALEWSSVDLENAEISVSRQVRHGRVDVSKSGKPRTVPILPGLLAVLKDWREKNRGEELVCPPLKYPGKIAKPRGEFLNGRTISDAMAAACKAAGLKPLTEYKGGRHTFASLWVLAGNDIYRLSKILGHSSVVVTERYAHLTKRLTDVEAKRADFKLTA